MRNGRTDVRDSGAALQKHPGDQQVFADPVGNLAGKPLALISGGALPRKLPRNLPAVLLQTAKEFPLSGIRYISRNGGERFETYANLLNRAQCVLAGLVSMGLRPQDFVLINLDESADFLAGFWACLLGGAVPVPTAPVSSYQVGSAGASRLLQITRTLQKGWLLSSSASEPALRSILPDIETIGLRVVWVEPLLSCSPAVQLHNPAADELAVLLFTSGSTGRPKAVMLSHENVLSSCIGSIHVNRFTSGEISLNWLTLSHIGALMRCTREVCLGATQIQVSPNWVARNPVRWLDLLTRFGVTTSWAPNFAYGLIVARLGDGETAKPWDFSHLKSLWTSGEPISPKTMKRFLAQLEPCGMNAGMLHTSWGMTEACSASFSHTYMEELLINGLTHASAGRPIPGISFRICGGDQRVLPEGMIGELQVKGPVCTYGYYGEGKSNPDCFTADGWLRTGDLGLISQGKLVVTGRAKDIIIINGRNYSNYEIEAAVEDCEGVEASYTAACGIRDHDSDTDRLVIFFSVMEIEESALPALLSRIRRAVVLNIGLTPDLLVPVHKEEIPKTGAGKIRRHVLRARFQEGEFDAIIKRLELLDSDSRNNNEDRRSRRWFPNSPAEKTLARIWADVLGKPPSSPEEDFFDTGGQSMQTVALLAEIEDKFGKNVRPSLLLENSRFTDLTRLIERKDPEPRAWQFLAPLQTSGFRPPIFCFHWAGGQAIGYRRFSRHFGSSQPLYGVQAPEAYGGPLKRRSIEQMCADYVQEIRQLQPHGPYFLLGHSWGGLLAFESARQLSDQHEEVGWLALLDTRGPGYSRSDHTLRRRVLNILKTLAKLPLNEKWRYIVHNLGEVPDYIYKGFWFLLTPKTGLAPKDIELINILARRQYHPGPYMGKILLFRASLIDDDLKFDFDPALGWGRFAPAGLEVIEIPGDHYTVISDPALAILTPRLMSEMDRVLPGQPQPQIPQISQKQ